MTTAYRSESPRARARRKVLVAIETLADRIAEQTQVLGRKADRDNLSVLADALEATQGALAVLDGPADVGMVDVPGDMVLVEDDDPDPDHGEDADHEHEDPEGRPVARRRIGFILPR